MRAGQVVVGVVIVLALLLAACGQAAPAAAPTQAPAAAPKPAAGAKVEYPAMSLKLGQPFNPDHVVAMGMQKFADLLSEQSGGKLKVEVFSSGSLVTGKNELEALTTGIVDFGSVVPVYHPGELPFLNETTLFQLLYSYKSMPTLFQRARPQLEQELAKQKIKLISHYPFTMGFYLQKAIDPKNPDFTGQKMRSPGGATTDIIRQFGGSTVDMPSPDIPVALRTGVVQGLSTSLSSWDTLGIMEDVPYAYYGIYTVGFGSFLGMQEAKYNALTPAVLQLIEKVARESEVWAYDNDQKQEGLVIKKAQNNPKVKPHQLTDEEELAWRTKAKPVIDVFAKRYGDMSGQFVKLAEEINAQVK